MSSPEPSLDFTVILYSVVASSALTRLTFSVELRNFMLLFAFGVLATDWVEYQMSVSRENEAIDGALLQFGLDMSVLVVWTILTLVPAGRMPLFTLSLCAFVFLQGVWDRYQYEHTHKIFAVEGNWELAAVLLIFGLVAILVEIQPAVSLVITATLFLALKQSIWRKIYTETKSKDVVPTL